MSSASWRLPRRRYAAWNADEYRPANAAVNVSGSRAGMAIQFFQKRLNRRLVPDWTEKPFDFFPNFTILFVSVVG